MLASRTVFTSSTSGCTTSADLVSMALALACGPVLCAEDQEANYEEELIASHCKVPKQLVLCNI